MDGHAAQSMFFTEKVIVLSAAIAAFVVHLTVSDLGQWWDNIVRRDLPTRDGVKIQAPVSQDRAVVAGVTDRSSVLWRFAETQA
jgi:hypothetical protein